MSEETPLTGYAIIIGKVKELRDRYTDVPGIILNKDQAIEDLNNLIALINAEGVRDHLKSFKKS